MKIDFKELQKAKKMNRRERIEFIEMYVNWLKKTPNKVWSKQQADFIDSVLKKKYKLTLGKKRI